MKKEDFSWHWKIPLVLFLVCLIAFLMMGNSYKPLMYRIFNDYEEVCVRYQQNVTAIPRCYHGDLGYQDCSEYEIQFSDITQYRHEYLDTNVCIEYALRRKIDIKDAIYGFDWCEVYPNSEECTV